MSVNAPDSAELANQLKERVYVTFTALAVLIALSTHHGIGATEALVTLIVTVLGTLLAVLVADVIARTVVHERALTRVELAHAGKTTLSALGAIAAPVALLAAASLGLIDADFALRAAVFCLIAALVVFGFLAIHKAHLPRWKAAVALFALAMVGLVVLALEVLAHG